MPSFSYVWPIGLVVLSNIVYQVCAKSVPGGMSPFVSLAVTYSVGAVVSLALFFVLGGHASVTAELKKINWAPFVLGLVIVGLEVGFIYAYRAGWEVSVAAIVQSAFLAIALLFVGFALYGEDLTPSKVLGVIICLVGLYFINR